MNLLLPKTLDLIIPALLTIKREAKAINNDEPELLKTFRLERINTNHLEKFKSFIGLNFSGVSLSYLYILAQRAQLSILVSDEFKLPVFGLVHLANELKFSDEASVVINKELVIHCRQSIVFEKNSEKLFVDFYVEFFQDNKVVAHCMSRYLASKPQQKAKSRNSDFKVSLDGFSHIDSFSFKVSDGPKYALVSGDFNFIHLHPLAAKLFGFKSSIIHGMYTAAKAFAVIENEHGKLLTEQKISFKKPILLPGNVNLFVNDVGELKVLDKAGETLHLEGTFRF